MEKITEEQAVEIAEWLGVNQNDLPFEEVPNGAGPLGALFKIVYMPMVDYLYNAEGQEALMDKLGRLELKLAISPATVHCDFHEIFIIERNFKFSSNTCVGSGIGETRQHALLLAILEMLKND